MINGKSICVVVPTYKVGKSIINFLETFPDYIDQIIVVDDKCPLKSGEILSKNQIIQNKKIKIIFNEENLGVGGAVKKGYLEAIKLDLDIIVKIDGDGQMNANEIGMLVKAIQDGSDYVKGNRFLNNVAIKNYPFERFYGNKILSLLSKFSTGYWDLYDPINGYTAITKEKLKEINLENIDNGYFFETDMLFNVYLLRAKARDIPVKIRYFKDQKQNLKIGKESINFLTKNFLRFYKRVNYCYLGNNFGLPGLTLIICIISSLFTLIYGGSNWYVYSVIKEISAPTGKITFSSISLLVTLFTLFMFISFDVKNNPNLDKNE